VQKRTNKEWRFSPGKFVLLMSVMVIIGFTLGMRSDAVIGAIAPAFGLKVATGQIDLSDVQETYRTLKSHFDGKLDEQKLIDGASRGLVAAAGDPYTVYMNQKEATEFDNDLGGKFVGIGAEIGLRDSKPTVIRTLKDTPAEKSGLQAGDTIAAVNDQASIQWTVDETVKKIRGEEGTTVKLSVLRGNQHVDYNITRASITNPSVESRVDGETGILTITRFDDQTTELARQAALGFKSQGVSKVILDLRGNGGGYLAAAREIASLWLENKVVVTERTGGKVTEELKSDASAPLKGMKTIVLVDAGSASASEIVAGALQDHKAATLVGEKTYGKGSVQTFVDLRMGAKLKVTVAKWYTPNGKNITREGISPDKKVAFTREDAGAGRDPQLDEAMKLLK
jgi:carboxyl-terminal processing protease